MRRAPQKRDCHMKGTDLHKLQSALLTSARLMPEEALPCPVRLPLR